MRGATWTSQLWRACLAEHGFNGAAHGGFASVTGKGVLGTVGGRRVLLGNAAMMEEARVDMASVEDRVDVRPAPLRSGNV